MNLDVEFDRMMRKVAGLVLDPIRRLDAISYMDKSRDWNERRSGYRGLTRIGKKNELNRTAEDFAREFERDVDRGWDHVMPSNRSVGSLPHSRWPEAANSPRSAPAPLQPAANTPKPVAPPSKPAAPAASIPPAAGAPKPSVAAPTPSPAASIPKPAAIPTASIPKPVGGGVPGPGIGASVSAAAGKVKSFAKMNPRLAVGVPLLAAGAYAAHRLFRKKPKQEEAKMASSNLDVEFDRMTRKVADWVPTKEELTNLRVKPKDYNAALHMRDLHDWALANEIAHGREYGEQAERFADTLTPGMQGIGAGAAGGAFDKVKSFAKEHPYATGAAVGVPLLAAGGYGAYKLLNKKPKQEEEKMAASNLDAEFDRMLKKVKVAGLSFVNDARQELRGLYPEWDKRDLDTRQLHEYLVSQGMDHRAHNRLNFGWDDIADELNAKPSKFPLDTTSVNWTRPAADAAQGVAETALAKYKPGLGERISGFAKAHPYATGAAIAAPVLAAGGYGAYKYLNKKPKQQGEEEKTSSLHMLYPSFFEEFSLLTQAHAQNK